jgi:hypothetical protein
MAFMLVSCVTIPTYQSPASGKSGLTKEQAISELFADENSLEYLEGIWVWDDDEYEVALKLEDNYNGQDAHR